MNMQGLRGFAWLLVLQSIGEAVSRGLGLPVPGPVLGMMLLLVALRWPLVREPVAACADFVLAHLSLLFVPVAVGVMTHLDLVAEYGARMFAVVIVSTLVGLAVTAWALQWAARGDVTVDAGAAGDERGTAGATAAGEGR